MQIDDDYDAAFADPQWSSASYILGPGSYTVEGLTAVSPFGTGGAAVQLLSTGGGAVPEPGTWLMMLLGFAGIGMAVRSSRTRTRLSYS